MNASDSPGHERTPGGEGSGMEGGRVGPGVTGESGAPELSGARAPFWTKLPARRLQSALDLSVLASALALAYFLRFDFDLPAGVRREALIQRPLVLAIQLIALRATGV